MHQENLKFDVVIQFEPPEEVNTLFIRHRLEDAEAEGGNTQYLLLYLEDLVISERFKSDIIKGENEYRRYFARRFGGFLNDFIFPFQELHLNLGENEAQLKTILDSLKSEMFCAEYNKEDKSISLYFTYYPNLQSEKELDLTFTGNSKYAIVDCIRLDFKHVHMGYYPYLSLIVKDKKELKNFLTSA